MGSFVLWSEIKGTKCESCIMAAAEEVVDLEEVISNKGMIDEVREIKKVGRLACKCRVFYELYWDRGRKGCPAHCDDVMVEIRRLIEVINYAKDKGIKPSKSLHAELSERQVEVERGRFYGLKQVYREEVNKPLTKPGSEKGERTHTGAKAKARNTMNDERFDEIGRKWWR